MYICFCLSLTTELNPDKIIGLLSFEYITYNLKVIVRLAPYIFKLVI